MAIVQPGIGFLCETNDGTLMLKDLLHSHNWKMGDIFIWIWCVRGWNGLLPFF